ncbi:hypothetical protein IKE87_01800 [Candidatus Saccharibacteria bacterium]|nr:hypothetical protein [Candidatus Saccharibacteria bacterium]
MADIIKKSGRRLARRWSKASVKAGEESREHIRENFVQRISHVRNVRLLVLEWSLLVIVLIMLAVTQAFWFSDSYAEDTFVDGGTYTEATLGDVKSLNPLFATTSSEEALSELMFSRIVAVDYSGHLGDQLAQSITASEDGRTWRVKLKEGLEWSDGEPITPEDVVFTIELIQNKDVNTIYESNFEKVKVSIDENGTIVFNLSAPYADFISALEVPVVPKHILEGASTANLVENNFSNTPVTSGAFLYNALQAGKGGKDDVYYLAANDKYFLGKPMLDSFAIHTYDTKQDLIDAVNAGEVTATAELSGADAEFVWSSNFLKRNSTLDLGAFVFFNTSRGVVASREMRSVIRSGINLTKIREAAPDTAKLDYPLLSSQIELSKYPEIPGYDFASSQAKVAELLAGKDENAKYLDIATVDAGYLPAVANALKEELASLGFEPTVTIYDEDQDFVSNIIAKRSYDILVYSVELGTEPDLLPYYYSSQASASGLNLSNYRNSLVDDLLLAARETMDENLRRAKYETFLTYFVNDVPAIGLYQPNLTYYYNKNVRTYSENLKLATAIDRFTDVTDWAVNKATKNKTP